MKEKIVLLVEDNPQDEKLALRALRKNDIGHEVVVARDGAEALDYLFARGAGDAPNSLALPQLILLDLKLPKVDGLVSEHHRDELADRDVVVDDERERRDRLVLIAMRLRQCNRPLLAGRNHGTSAGHMLRRQGA